MSTERDLKREFDALTAGYDGAMTDEPKYPKVWTIKRADRYYTSKFTLVVSCNDVPRGAIHLEDEAELEWWTRVIAGRNVQEEIKP